MVILKEKSLFDKNAICSISKRNATYYKHYKAILRFTTSEGALATDAQFNLLLIVSN